MASAKGKLVWTDEEDALLKALVEKHGDTSWSAIARDMGTKGSKQCRRRWKNVLTINAKCTGWTEEEDARLIEYHHELGNKWTAISKRFGDRTDNATKNRWHALCRKRPELASMDDPISKVGVKRGTKTHSLLMGDSTSVSDPSVGLQQLSSKEGIIPTPFDQKDTSMSPADFLRQNLDGIVSGSMQQQHLSRLSQLSNLARAFDDMKSTRTATGQIPSMELSDSFQKWLESTMFNSMQRGSMQMPSQPLGILGGLDNLAVSNLSSDGASKTDMSKGSETAKDIPGQKTDPGLSFSGLPNSLSVEQRDLLSALLQQSMSIELDKNDHQGKRKRESTIDLEKLMATPSQDDLQFLLSSFAWQLDSKHSENDNTK